jgi:hypothetical protein
MKRLTPTILTLLLSVSGGAAQMPDYVCPDGDRKISVFGPQDVIPTCVTPKGTYYVNVLSTDPGWRKAIENYEIRVAQFHAAQKKRLQSAVPIVWRKLTVGSADTNNFLKRYPYLKEYLDGLESGTPVSIAENRAPANKKAGVNLLFVVIEGQTNCGTGGCDFTIYADSGAGYKKVVQLLEFPVQARVSRTVDGGVSVFLPFVHKHAPNPDDPPEGTYFEYTLKSNSLERTEPPTAP